MSSGISRTIRAGTISTGARPLLPPSLDSSCWAFHLWGIRWSCLEQSALTFIFGALTILRLWRSLAPKIPGWLLVAGIVVFGTVHPMLWTLNSPSIYTASNAAGQAFLIGGVFFITVASTGLSVKSLDLALAGMFWGLAIATRLTTGAAVVVLLLGAVVLIGAGAWRMQDWRQAASQLLALGLPFAVVMLIYGYYNFVRFGNFLEPGFRFQLTEANKSVQFAHDQLFSLQFLIPNSLYHFFAPLQLRSHFPFLRPVYGEYLPFSQFIKRLGIVPGPGIGAITGLIFAAPTLALNLPLLSRLLSAAGPTEIASKPAVERSSRQGFIVPLGHIGLVFFLAGVASSLPVLAYTYAASRYDLDFVPLLALSSVIGMWYLYEDSRPYPLRSKLAVLLIVALVVTSTAISFVLALSGAGSKFDDFKSVLVPISCCLFLPIADCRKLCGRSVSLYSGQMTQIKGTPSLGSHSSEPFPDRPVP